MRRSMTARPAKKDDWTKGMSEEEKVAVFEELFLKDVESWFSQDIGCCDNCYDDFIAKWPYAYSADNAKFQCNSIDLGTFYSGSRLSQYYSKREYDRLLPSIRCPNCGESLTHNIWPYELPFEPPEDYESILDEIAERAAATPFLLLEQPFCGKVRDVIQALFQTTKEAAADGYFARGRSLPPDHVPELRDFDFPPADKVKEGRYNHAGDPVLYLASSEEVCRVEMREAKDLCIARFRFPVKLRVLDLMNPHEQEGEHAKTLSFMVFSALLSARSKDRGYERPEYVFSRFVKDCAQSAGFDAVRYPSTRVGVAKSNLVVINRALTLAKYAQDFTVIRG